ncbi:hypothetical protein CDD83_7460 [Cordyceps sp. RAO-2017]|nr:hypothetical protein CDD83_7460 [Cordyceps sp. RAO-2017]
MYGLKVLALAFAAVAVSAAPTEEFKQKKHLKLCPDTWKWVQKNCLRSTKLKCCVRDVFDYMALSIDGVLLDITRACKSHERETIFEPRARAKHLMAGTDIPKAVASPFMLSSAAAKR